MGRFIPSTSTLKHLRFFHSLLLTPVFFLALAVHPPHEWGKALLLFAIITLSIFPSSNGLNSFYDKDKGSIGGLEIPPSVEPQLLIYSLFLEFVGLGLCFVFLGTNVFLAIFVYGVFSKLYSHPMIRIKARPWLSLLIVAVFQGPLIYLVTTFVLKGEFADELDLWMSLVSFFMIVATYPITQVYQHQEDAERGDLTISRLFGIRGTFIFCFVSLILVGISFALALGPNAELGIFCVLNIPVGVVLMKWFRLVQRDESNANYARTAYFLKTLTLFSNLSFLILFLWRLP